MFKKIRKSFIWISMTAVSSVLIISIFMINFFNFHTVEINCDQLIQMISEAPFDRGFEMPDNKEINSNRFFIAESFDGKEFKLTTMKVESISEQEALDMVYFVKSENLNSGYYDVYRFKKITDDKYVFLDCTNRINDAERFLKTSIYASVGGLTAFFLLIFFGSKIVLKPVKESYDKQKRFITNASHSLKTPLTIISANNELIEIKQGVNDNTKNISSEVDKMNVMIKELISYSKMEEKEILTKEKINISSLLENILEEFNPLFNELQLNVKCEIEENLFVTNNKDAVKQMLTIILDNARKYAVKNISISLVQEKKHVAFYQSNDTNGIENGNLNFFADRFYRSNNIRESRDGSGIGLSILNELALKTKIKTSLYGEDGNFNIKLLF